MRNFEAIKICQDVTYLLTYLHPYLLVGNNSNFRRVFKNVYGMVFAAVVAMAAADVVASVATFKWLQTYIMDAETFYLNGVMYIHAFN